MIHEGLETALSTHPDLKTVIRTVDPIWFTSDVNWKGRESYPEYLYDKNPFNELHSNISSTFCLWKFIAIEVPIVKVS